MNRNKRAPVISEEILHIMEEIDTKNENLSTLTYWFRLWLNRDDIIVDRCEEGLLINGTIYEHCFKPDLEGAL